MNYGLLISVKHMIVQDKGGMNGCYISDTYTCDHVVSGLLSFLVQDEGYLVGKTFICYTITSQTIKLVCVSVVFMSGIHIQTRFITKSHPLIFLMDDLKSS